jgi:2-dehydropantoate 2-reductase
MRLLIVGAGSTGGYFGGRLLQAGRDVTFLVHAARAQALQQQGLQIVSPHGNATLRPKLVLAHDITATFDVVFLGVKSYQLAAAIEDFAPAVGPNTMIVPVLNGMKHMDLLVEHFGHRPVIGAICLVVATVDAAGRIVQLDPRQELVYGELDGSASPRIHELDALMQGAGFTARLSTEIEREMWEKWILLSCMGGITCLMRGSIGELEAVHGGREFALEFIDEVVAIVRRVGKPPRDAFLAMTRELLTAKDSALTASMYRDLQRGAPIEADQIIGDLLARARRADLAAPLLQAAYASLSIYQNRRLAPAGRTG